MHKISLSHSQPLSSTNTQNEMRFDSCLRYVVTNKKLTQNYQTPTMSALECMRKS
mgnify:CR=1 FL=1